MKTARKFLLGLGLAGLACALATPALADVNVDFKASGVYIFQHNPDPAMENPLIVLGYLVAEFRDANSGGAPDWSSIGSVDGSVNQAWLRDSLAAIETTTTVASPLVAVHLQGDSNDGKAEIYVDGVLKIRIDMYDAGPSTNNVFVLITQLSDSTHVITVDDVGTSTHGGSGDDVAVWGASVLQLPGESIPALTLWGVLTFVLALVAAAAILHRRQVTSA